MTVARQRIRGWFRVATDRQAFTLAALFLAVQAGALALAFRWQQTGTAGDISAPGGVDGPAAGAGWALGEVVIASVFVVGLYLSVRYLPAWARDACKTAVKILFVFVLGAVTQSLTVLAATLVAYIGYRVLDATGLWWLGNNAIALTIAVVWGALVGLALNAWALLVFLVGMTVYDHVFADHNPWMEQMAGSLVSWRLPVMVVKPSQWRFEWGLLFHPDGEDIAATDSAWGIGTADLLLPAAFTVAVATGNVLAWPRLGATVVTGGILIAALRVRQKMLDQKSGAGLPPLTTGAAVAFALVLVPSLFVGVVP